MKKNIDENYSDFVDIAVELYLKNHDEKLNCDVKSVLNELHKEYDFDIESKDETGDILCYINSEIFVEIDNKIEKDSELLKSIFEIVKRGKFLDEEIKLFSKKLCLNKQIIEEFFESQVDLADESPYSCYSAGNVYFEKMDDDESTLSKYEIECIKCAKQYKLKDLLSCGLDERELVGLVKATYNHDLIQGFNYYYMFMMYLKNYMNIDDLFSELQYGESIDDVDILLDYIFEKYADELK